MSWTWLGLAVLVLLAFSMVDGYQKGFVKEVVSAFLVLISVVMVWLINPYVNQFIRENTAVSFCFPTVTARDFRNLNHRGTTAQTKCKQSGYSCPDKFLHPLPPFITILLSCRLLNRH